MQYERIIAEALLGGDIQLAEDRVTLKMLVCDRMFERDTQLVADQRRSFVIEVDGRASGPYGDRERARRIIADLTPEQRQVVRVLDGRVLFGGAEPQDWGLDPQPERVDDEKQLLLDLGE